MCAESIRVAAKLCPHCRHWQRRWGLLTAGYGSMPLVFVAFGLAPAILFDHFLGPGRDFAPFHDQIVVTGSQVNYSQTEKGAFIAVVGMIKNNSKFSWKEVELEVQYFDKDGKMIDTKSDQGYNVTILQQGERAFRIRAQADRPEAAYASHKIFVRAAKDG